MITIEQLDDLLNQIETERVEKTISKNDADKFGEAICSFCNDMPGLMLPGYLIVGVLDNGIRNGTVVDDQLMQTLMAFRTDGRIVPPPAMIVAKFSFQDGEVAVVEVKPSFQPPVRYKGKVCIRIGARKGVANEAEERILSEKRSSFAKTFDSRPCYGSSSEDLSTEIFKLTYLPNAIDKETLRINGREIHEQLASLKFYDLKAEVPTNAGVLMFGKNPRFFLPGAYVQYVRFDGNDEVSEFDFERSFDGDLATQMKIMNDFIKSQIVKMVQHKLGEDFEYNYPLAAIQELLYNAIIHKDYESNAPIKFYEFSDRMEIINPGGLYGNARPENFPNTNDYRNPVLAEAAKNLGYINAFNVGVKRAIAALQKNGNPDPKFIFDQPASFGVKVYKKKP